MAAGDRPRRRRLSARTRTATPDISVGEAEFELTGAEAAGYDQFDNIPTDFDNPFRGVRSRCRRPQPRSRKSAATSLLWSKARPASRPGKRACATRSTDIRIDDLEADESFENDYALLLPSASVKLAIDPARPHHRFGRPNQPPSALRLSVAGDCSRKKLGDNDLLGNPRT